jgi:hypothetical protein
MVFVVVSLPAKRRLMMKSATASSGKQSSSISLPSTPLLPSVGAPVFLCTSMILFILLMIFSLA